MEIKGDRRGLRLIARHFTTQDEFIAELRSTLKEKQSFLGKTSLLIEVPNTVLTSALFEAITTAFNDFPDLNLRGIQQSNGDDTGLRHIEPARTAELVAPPKVIRHTIRSGQRITHAGDLIIVGDVNPGGTVMAGGDIMVFGWLRGTAFAGQPDADSRVVYALRFEPSQVRIASVLALGNAELSGNPEKALIEDGELVVKPWTDVRLPDAITQERTAWSDRFSSATPS